MFEKSKGRNKSVKDRSKSISATKLDEKNRKEKKAWLWDPDEVTGFGNRRLLRSILLSGKAINEELNEEEDLEDFHDHIACLITDSYNEVVELYKEFTEAHAYWGHLALHPDKYKDEGYPRDHKYTWKVTLRHRNGSQTEKDVVLKVGEYVDKVFQFFVHQMENDDVFPANDFMPFPDDFKIHAKELNTLLFRVLAIMFSNEDPTVHKLAKPLKDLLQKVLYYSWKWDMLDDSEQKCIDFLVEPIRKQYDIDYAAELEECL